VRVGRLFVNPLHLSVEEIRLSKVLLKNDFFIVLKSRVSVILFFLPTNAIAL